MKKISLRKIVASIVFFAVLSGTVTFIPCQNKVAAASEQIIELRDADLSKDVSVAIQNALDRAHKEASEEEPFIIRLPQ